MGNFASFVTSTELTIPVMLVRILFSMIAGFILGFERKVHLQNAGLRTHMLICISSTLMMLVSLFVAEIYAPTRGDPARIAAQIVSGIGFLGGGAIIRQGLNIKGLNSAATVWAAAGIGMSIGCGMIIVSFVAVLLCVLCLFVLERFEARYFPAERVKQLELIFKDSAVNMKNLRKEIQARGLIITNTDFVRDMSDTKFKIVFTVKTPFDLDIINLTEGIKYIGHLEKVKMSD